MNQFPEFVAQAFVDAWNDRDADRLADLFEAEAEFVNVTGLWWHNREAIRKAHAYGLAEIFSHSTLSLVTVRVKWLAPELAVVHAKMRLTGQTPTKEVANPGKRTNIFSFVMRRSDEGCARQTTDDNPTTKSRRQVLP